MNMKLNKLKTKITKTRALIIICLVVLIGIITFIAVHHYISNRSIEKTGCPPPNYMGSAIPLYCTRP